MKFLRIIAILLVAGVLVYFSLLNRVPLVLTLPFSYTVTIPFYGFFFGILIAGILLGGMGASLRRLKLKRALNAEKLRNQVLENELNAYKNEQKTIQGTISN